MMGKTLCTIQSIAAEHPTIVYRDTHAVLRALKPQQSVYLFDRSKLQQNAHYFLAHFPGRVSYAVKANTQNRVLATLIAQGVRDFDVASIEEIRALRRLDDTVKLHFNNPVKPEQAIARACGDYGVHSFALDDEAELEKILRVCPQPGRLTLSVRFKLDSHSAAYDFGSKFGANMSQAVWLLKKVKSSGAAAALTFHPGSQCTDAGEYRRYIEAAAKISAEAGLTLQQLNVGGGFPEYYSNTRLASRQHYFEIIRRAFQGVFAGSETRLMCEPGRAMVASSASLLCQVIHVRATHRQVFLTDGIYGGLQEQSIANLALPIRYWRGETPLCGETGAFTAFGPTCDPVDRLPRAIIIPLAIRTGDYLEFGLMGAYGSATSTRFNGFESARYLEVEAGWSSQTAA